MIAPALRRRLALAVLLAAAIALYLTLSPRWPKDQVLHVVLGDAAPRVTEVRVRYADATSSAEDWTREVTFRYALNSAPRVVTHETRLPDGDYVVEIDVTSSTNRTTTRRRATLHGGTTSLDVSEEVAR
jgi:hypothetical protein